MSSLRCHVYMISNYTLSATRTYFVSIFCVKVSPPPHYFFHETKVCSLQFLAEEEQTARARVLIHLLQLALYEWLMELLLP